MSVFTEPAFSVGSEVYTWGDAVLGAMLRGEWAAAEAASRDGLACWKRAREAGEAAPQSEVSAAATAFRYERDLISAQDTEAWLKRWGLTVEAWMNHFRRTILCRRWAGELPDVRERYPVTPDELEPVVAVDLVCTGRLDAFAQSLAERAAVAQAMAERAAADGATDVAAETEAEAPALPEVGVPGLPGLPAAEWGPRLARLARLERALGAYRDARVSPQTLKDQIHTHHIDWIRLDCRALTFPDEQMAREAVLCVREDGVPFDEVAADAHLRPSDTRFYLDDVDARLRERLLGAQEGDVIGPVARDGGFTIYSVTGKRMPTDQDPDIRRRAETGILSGALKFEAGKRVRWEK